MRYRYPLAALVLLAAPNAFAQALDCANLPTMDTAEPAAYAQCQPPIVVETGESATVLPGFAINLRSNEGGGGGFGRGFMSFDYTAPTGASLVAVETENYYAGDFAGNDFTKLYAINDAEAFVSISPTTGVITPIATATTPSTGSHYGGMA